MKKVYVEGQWYLHGDQVGTLEATVPGCVHTDLIKNGVLGDLYWRDNSKTCQWIENCDFSYTCTFDAEEDEDATLVFEGLDTYCEIYLNGEHIGSADDMHIPHGFDVGGKLKRRDNELRVDFRSPIKEIADKPERKGAFTKERLWTRRMQCTYSWDWAERFVTCGIFRPVYICYGKDMHVDSAYIFTENIDKYSAQICVELELANYSEGGLLQIDVLSPDGDILYSEDVYSNSPLVVRRYDIVDPQLWYPLGYGEHPLYTLCVTVGDNVYTDTFGIRTLKILQIPDKEGSEYDKLCREMKKDVIGQMMDQNESFSGFQLVVNGIRILCMGGNWVPIDPFPSNATDERVENMVAMAAKMGVNMLRVWGGGTFETRAFFDACDREGILVSQDFLMACGEYPEEEDWFIDRLSREAEYATKLMRNHPCFAFWSGDNENGTRGSDAAETYRGRKVAYEASAPAVYKNDHTRQFLPSSPYGGSLYASRNRGTTHNTNYLGYTNTFVREQDGENYKEHLERFLARFVAEEPVFGAVSRRSLLRFMTVEDLNDPEQEMLHFHTKNDPGLMRPAFVTMSEFALKMMGEATDGEDRYFKYKYLQYEWTRVVSENMRRHIGFWNGLVFWMYNDNWPAAMGWAYVDFYGVPKAAFYSFRRCAKPVISSVTCVDGAYAVTVSNVLDQAVSVEGRAYLCRKSEGMRVVGESSFSMSVGDYAAATTRLDFEVDEDHVVVCDITCDEGEDRSFYNHGRLAIKPCADSLRVVARDDKSITVAADSYVHIVELEGDCVFSDNYFSLMPGESKTVTWEAVVGARDNVVELNAYTL